ncbi:MAG TPA: TIM barrel protein [Puia sp.]|nr:TIM barrel protein [Puia sp.]
MTTTRRSFLQQASLATGALFVPAKGLFAAKQLIGLQLYTLRNEIFKVKTGPADQAANLKSILEKVAAIGYNSVEAFGFGNGKYFGLSVEEFANIIKQNSLVSPSGHYGLNAFLMKEDEQDLDSTIEAGKKMSHAFITIPFLADALRGNADAYKSLSQKMNKAGEKINAAGMKLAYHNHNFEFKDLGDGKTGMSVMLAETDPKLVSFEMDMYWVTRAGANPEDLIKAHPGRFKMWHIKDMETKKSASTDLNADQAFTEVGTGVIAYKDLFKLKKLSGMEYFFVEQDQVKLPVYESISKSYQNLKNNILA